jgi:glutaredoxin
MTRIYTTSRRLFPLMLAASILRACAAFPLTRHNRAALSVTQRFASVTGSLYTSEDGDAPTIRLFTKEGCTLCDKVKDVLSTLKDELPHSLDAVDITDEDHEIWHEKYKYDIPVLHVGEQYWTKHRITEDEARDGLTEAISGSFSKRIGEPDAGEMERRQAARQNKKQ